MLVNEMQNKIVKLLWDFNSLREEHIKKILGCKGDSIGSLVAKNIIVRENNGIVRHKLKEINNRNVAAFDVVMDYLDRDPEIIKGKYPANVTMKTKHTIYDIIAVKDEEFEKICKDIDTVSTADKLIIIIETKEYKKRKINTTKPCYICTFPPLEIVDSIN
jgi:hypothetical protein